MSILHVLHLFFNSFEKELDLNLIDRTTINNCVEVFWVSFVIMIFIAFVMRTRRYTTFLPLIYLHWTKETQN